MTKQKKSEFITMMLFVSVLFSIIVVSACHGGGIQVYTGPIRSTSTYDYPIGNEYDMTLQNKEVTLVAAVTSYEATFEEYTHVRPPEEVAKDYEGISIDEIIIDNAVYSFEGVNGPRLDRNSNGKIDVYDESLYDDVNAYTYFLVVPIYNMGTVEGDTQYLPDAIVYPLNECYRCEEPTITGEIIYSPSECYSCKIMANLVLTVMKLSPIYNLILLL